MYPSGPPPVANTYPSQPAYVPQAQYGGGVPVYGASGPAYGGGGGGGTTVIVAVSRFEIICLISEFDFNFSLKIKIRFVDLLLRHAAWYIVTFEYTEECVSNRNITGIKIFKKI